MCVSVCVRQSETMWACAWRNMKVLFCSGPLSKAWWIYVLLDGPASVWGPQRNCLSLLCRTVVSNSFIITDLFSCALYFTWLHTNTHTHTCSYSYTCEAVVHSTHTHILKGNKGVICSFNCCINTRFNPLTILFLCCYCDLLLLLPYSFIWREEENGNGDIASIVRSSCLHCMYWTLKLTLCLCHLLLSLSGLWQRQDSPQQQLQPFW